MTLPPVAAADRAVALAYRRRHPHGGVERGDRAREGALARYLELRPEASADRLAASARVAQLIAGAAAADPRSFWHGPEA